MSNEFPLISVIVPVYKVEKYIVQCAKSIFAQTYSNLEIIFVDDCSPDRSVQLLEEELKKWDNRKNQTIILHHSENRGLAAGRATGLEAATGEYFCFVDSDDWIEVECCQKMMDFSIKSKCDIATFDYYDEEYDFTRYVATSTVENAEHFVHSILQNGTDVMVWNKFYRTAFFRALNFIYPYGIQNGEDFCFTVQLLLQKPKISHVTCPLYHYRMNLSSLTHQFTPQTYRHVIAYCNFISKIIENTSYEHDFAYHKAKVKLHIIASGTLPLTETCTLFPEIKNLIFSLHDFSLLYRCALWCYAYRFFNVAGIFIKLKFIFLRCKNYRQKKNE